MGKKASDYEWRRKRGFLNRALERIEDAPTDLLMGKKGALSDSRKRKIYETGTVGTATILKVPGKARVSEFGVQGPYLLRVQLPGEEPYEVKSWQDVMRSDWERMQPDAVVEVRVDPDDRERLVLCPPEAAHADRSAQETARFMDSSRIIAEGKRARAVLLSSRDTGVIVPGGQDPVHELELELSAEAEPEPWKVRIGQRVPADAVAELLREGTRLEVAYLEVDGGDSVAVDWPASSGGRFA